MTPLTPGEKFLNSYSWGDTITVLDYIDGWVSVPVKIAPSPGSKYMVSLIGEFNGYPYQYIVSIWEIVHYGTIYRYPGGRSGVPENSQGTQVPS